MNNIIYVVLECWILASFGRLWVLIWARYKFLKLNNYKNFNKDDKTPSENTDIDKKEISFFIIFIPLLREQTLVNEIIKHFSKLLHKEGKMFIILATTKRESIDSLKEDITTSNLVDQALSKLPKGHNFRHYCTDGSDTSKGDQINQALQLFLSEFQDLNPQNIYIGVYDADSRPDPTYLASSVDAWVAMICQVVRSLQKCCWTMCSWVELVITLSLMEV